MRLIGLTTLQAREAFIAKAVSDPNLFADALMLMEEKVNVSNFHYTKAKNDPEPEVIILGKWQHPKTGNKLLGGINLHYLDPEQADALYAALPKVMAKDSLKAKYWEARSLIPDIMTKAYRTYDEQHIDNMRSREIEVELATDEAPEQAAIEPLPYTQPTELPDRGEDKPEQGRDRTPVIRPVMGVPSTPTPSIKPIPAPTKSPEPSVKLPKDQGLEVPETPKVPEKAKEEPEKLSKAPEPEGIQPEPSKGMLSKIKGAISKLASMVRSKLGGTKAAKPKAEPKPEPKFTTTKSTDLDKHREVTKLNKLEDGHQVDEMRPEDEIVELDKIEKEHELNKLDQIEKEHEIDKLGQIEKEHKIDEVDPNRPYESFENRLNAILETYGRTSWTSAEYIKWHEPERFITQHPEMGMTVLEAANGNNFLAVYNIYEDILVVDIADNHQYIIENAAWDKNDTIRFAVRNGKIFVSLDDPILLPMAESLLKSPLGELLNELVA